MKISLIPKKQKKKQMRKKTRNTSEILQKKCKAVQNG